MTQEFPQTTAEHVLAVAEASVTLNAQADIDAISRFVDLPKERTENALALAVSLGLAIKNKETYGPKSPLCKLLRTPYDQERVAILRITIESYKPFLIFREELIATGNPDRAAHRTKEILNFNCHKDEVKETLLSLATYSGALTTSHGNVYEQDLNGVGNLLNRLAAGSQEESAAIHAVQKELGDIAAKLVNRDEVISPLASSLRHASNSGTGREAAMYAGNAVESFLNWYASDSGVDLTGETGINGKLDRLRKQKMLPQKLVAIGMYIGHIRNAADHGSDKDIEAPWDISDASGLNIFFVASGFIKSAISYKKKQYEI